MNGSSYRKGEPHFTVDLVPKRWVQMTFLYNSCIFPQTNMTISNMFRRRRQWHPTTVLLPGKSYGWRSLVGCSPWGREESDMTEWLHFHFHALEKEMATHSSVLAWRIPGTGEPGGLPSMGSHRVWHNWSDLAAAEQVSSLCFSFHLLKMNKISSFRLI